jgi:predicted  nucleic acid-binding Zn-ribbon protein
MPRDEMDEVAILMEQIHKNLEGLGEFRKRFNEVLEAVGARIEALEKKIEARNTEGVQLGTADQEERLKTIEKNINMIEEHLEKGGVKAHTHKDLQESIENAVSYTEELEKKFKDDNKYMEGLDVHIRSLEESINERFKEISREISVIGKENDKTNRFRVALQGFLKAVLGD